VETVQHRVEDVSTCTIGVGRSRRSFGSCQPPAHFAPGAQLAGNVYVEQGALLGIGACVIPGRRIGAWSVVGAGGVVIDDIPPYVTATGVPARTWRYADPPESLGPWTLPSPTERND
jgi:acetyltransferase-like isoleucine patch superfamily enzyme